MQSYTISQPIPFNATIGAVWAIENSPGSSAAGTAGDCIDLQYSANSTTSTATPASFLASGAVFNFASATVSSAGYGLIPLTGLTTTAGGYNTAFTTTVGNPPQVARGGFFKAVVKTVATVPGGDLVIAVTLNRARNGSGVDPVAVGTYDPDSDIF